MKKLSFFSFLFAAIALSAQDPDELDLTFSGTGWRSVTFSQPYQIDPKKFVFQEDGKVIFGGERLLPDEGSEAVIIRYNVDGTLDGTYGSDGIILSDDNDNIELNTESEDFILQADGKLLVAGSSFYAQSRIIRFTESGQPDPSFGNGDGYVDFPYTEYGEVFGIKLQSDQKIIFTTKNSSSGNTFKVVRLNPDGTLDTTFGNGGEFAVNLPEEGQTASSYSLLITQDDKIVFSYREFIEPQTFRFHIRRLTSNGENDNSFADNGTFSFELDFINNTSNIIPFRADYLGRIYMMIPFYDEALSQYRFELRRLNQDGSPDVDFDGAHPFQSAFSAQTSYSFDIEVYGNYVYTMYESGTSAVNLARFDINDGLDESFGDAGNLDATFLAIPPINSAVFDISPTGSIFIGSSYNIEGEIIMLAVKLNGSESTVSFNEIDKSDSSFNIYPNPADHRVTIQTNSTGMLSYRIVNICGALISSGTVNSSGTVDVSLFQPGAYFLDVEGYETQRLIVTGR